MAESVAAVSETKKVINPRVEIDTSPPFESVKEAVDRFGGSGPWIPHHLLRLAAAHHHDTQDFDVEKMEEQAVQLERDLMMKERQTLNLLKELESAKRFVEGLKHNFTPEFSSFISSPDLKFESHSTTVLSPGLIFTELNQAKSNLNKTSIDLAVIQASVESLNKKMRREKVLLENRNKMQVPNSEGVLSIEENRHVHHQVGLDTSLTISKGVNYEVEQFKKMTEASRYEVMKAMTEIERTKNSIKMAEMRLNAAKKMEEAAKAVEAIAIAERNILLSGEDSSEGFHQKTDGVSLSFEEYHVLTQKAQQAEELCKTKFMDTNGFQRTNEARHLEVPILEKFEESTNGNNPSLEVDNEEGSHQTNVVENCFSRTREERSGNISATFRFRNSHNGSRNPRVLNGNESYASTEKTTTRGFRSKTSIGDILSRKLIVQDNAVVGTHVENSSEGKHVSLSQMLREQSRLILHPAKTTGEENVEKHYFLQKKRFGFIQVPLPTKQSKKKTQPMNMR